jgi:hypothetical protein
MSQSQLHESDQPHLQEEANVIQPPEQHDEEAKEEVEVKDQVQDISEKELQKHLHDIEREVEADLNGTEWEGLDTEDAGDPMMVSEYVNDMFENLRVVEVRSLVLP